MTCIVAVWNDQGVWMGADSCTSPNESYTQLLAESKIIEVGPLLIGLSGSFSVTQTLHEQLKIGELENGQNPTEFLRKEVFPKIRKIHTEMPITATGDTNELLIALSGKAYWSEAPPWSLTCPSKSFHAIGSGTYYALGSLHSTAGKRPEERVRMALEAASEFDPGVRPPFRILKQECLKIGAAKPMYITRALDKKELPSTYVQRVAANQAGGLR